jgi:hypothetical protein
VRKRPKRRRIRLPQPQLKELQTHQEAEGEAVKEVEEGKEVKEVDKVTEVEKVQGQAKEEHPQPPRQILQTLPLPHLQKNPTR